MISGATDGCHRTVACPSLPQYSQLRVFYLDPSAGSMMLQLILGGLAGVAIALRLFWARILSFFGRGKGGEATDPETDGS